MGVFVLVFLFFISQINAKTLEIISPFAFEECIYPFNFEIAKNTGLELRYHKNSIFDLQYNSEIKKVIVFDPQEINFKQKVPKEKLVLVIWEPKNFKKEYCDLFSHIYTWNDDLVDGVKFFKLYYSDLQPMISNVPSFKDKKFCILISGNWVKHRKKIIEFFNKKQKGDFEFYGRSTRDLKNYHKKNYKGPIIGKNTGQEKLLILSKYKFCICFENHTNLNGYISEKIFHCFAGGCVPVYWGAPNIEKHIPKECFVDYRDFKNDEELYKFLKNMTQETYDKYIQNIKNFIQSEKAKVFTPEYFVEMICKEINL